MKSLVLKRSFDMILSGLGILGSLPLWICFSLLIWLEDRGPIFYTQERVGRNGRLFKAYKFRSMIKNAEQEGVPVQAEENDPRVTRVGRVLRKMAMDELPQLLNIFKGDMSFVGPRALRPQEREVNGDSEVKDLSDISGYHRRQAVQPGLTGLAQIFLPADAPRRKKFRYDLLYIRKRTFCLDFKLILLSFWITFRAKWETKENKLA